MPHINIMSILLVDNGTIHIQELARLLQMHNVTTISRAELNAGLVKNYDLLIMSGSSDNAVAKNPLIYETEINIIKNSDKPIIGICMGFEVIAYSFGATLKELPFKESGLVEIVAITNDKIFAKYKMFKVAENHRWVVTKIAEPLKELAISKDGIEVIKHTSKPIYGFQFHPEIVTPVNTGRDIFDNVIAEIATTCSLE